MLLFWVSGWVLLGPVRSYWVLSGPTGSRRVLRGPVRSCWIPWGPAGSRRVLLGPVGSCWIPSGPAGSCGVLLDSTGAVCTVEAIISLVESFSWREQAVELVALLLHRPTCFLQVSVSAFCQSCRFLSPPFKNLCGGGSAERRGLQQVDSIFTVQSFSLWVCEGVDAIFSVAVVVFMCLLFVVVFWQYYFVLHNFNKHFCFLLLMTMFLCRWCNQSVEAQFLLEQTTVCTSYNLTNY